MRRFVQNKGYVAIVVASNCIDVHLFELREWISTTENLLSCQRKRYFELHAPNEVDVTICGSTWLKPLKILCLLYDADKSRSSLNDDHGHHHSWIPFFFFFFFWMIRKSIVSYIRIRDKENKSDT